MSPLDVGEVADLSPYDGAALLSHVSALLLPPVPTVNPWSPSFPIQSKPVFRQPIPLFVWDVRACARARSRVCEREHVCMWVVVETVVEGRRRVEERRRMEGSGRELASLHFPAFVTSPL